MICEAHQRFRSVRRAAALALSAVLLSAPALAATYTGQTAGSHSYGGDPVYAGGAVFADGEDGVTSSDAEWNFTGNSAASDSNRALGGAVFADRSVTLTADGAIVFEENSVHSGSHNARGGAITSFNGGVTLAGGTVTLKGNSVDETGERGEQAQGGAVFASLDISITAPGAVTIDGNTVRSSAGQSARARGGALASWHSGVNVEGASVTISGNSVSEDAVTGWVQGGAVFAEKDIVITATDGTVEIKNNSVTAKESGSTDSQAGSSTGADGEELNSVRGGALDSAAGSVTIKGAGITLSGNSVTENSNSGWIRGGAVFAAKNISLDATGAIDVSGNRVSASAFGNVNEAVNVRGGALNSKTGGVTISGGSVTISGNSVSEDNAHSGIVQGGAVYASGDIDIFSTGAVNVNDNTVTAKTRAGTNEEITVRGGALDSAAGNVKIEGASVTLKGNTVTEHDVAQGWVQGGAVIAQGTIELRSAGNITVNENVVTASENAASEKNITVRGGALDSKAGTILIDGGSITMKDNTVTQNNVYEGTVQGGAAFASLDIKLRSSGDVTVNENKVTATAAANSNKTVTVRGGALDSASGGVLIEGGSITLSGDTVTEENVYEGWVQGGAVIAQGNVVLSSDGAVNVTGNRVTATASSTSNKEVTVRGGALDSKAGDVKLYGGSITLSGNTVTETNVKSGIVQGGAVYADGGIELTATDTVTINNNQVSAKGDIEGNSSVTVRGGALDAYNGKVVISSNGNIIVSDNSVSSKTRIKGNLYGGAIYAPHGVELTSVGTIVLNGNKLVVDANSYGYAQGGAIYTNSGTVLLSASDDITLSNNELSVSDIVSGGAGGQNQGVAIYNYGGDITILSSKSVYVQDNKSQNGRGYSDAYGAIYTHDGNIRIESAEEISFINNSLLASGAVGAAALYSNQGSISLSADVVTFKGNIAHRPDWISDASGVYAGKVFEITARRAEFLTSTDIVMVGQKITFSDTLRAVPGWLFNAGRQIVTGTGDLELDGVTHSDATTIADVTGFIAPTVDFSASKLRLVSGYSTEYGEHSADFALIRRVNAEVSFPDPSYYRNGFVHSSDVEIDGSHRQKLTLQYFVSDLTWNGGKDEKWAIKDGAQGWSLDVDMNVSSDFYLLDSVTFPEEVVYPTVTVSDDIIAGRMTVLGSYDFTGDGSLTVDNLQVFGGDSTFEREVTARKATLSNDASLTLKEPLTVKDSFTQNSGWLKVEAGTAEEGALVLGSDTAILSVEGGANLYIEGIGLVEEGSPRRFHITDGFAENASVWGDSVLSGDATGVRLSYKGEDGGTSFDVVVTAEGNLPLIWRGQAGKQWNEDVQANTVWVRAGDETNGRFPPKVIDGAYIQDSFFRGDTVIFDGKVYDSLKEGTEVPASGVVEVPLIPGEDGMVAPERVYVTGGQNHFTGTGATLSADALYVRFDGTSADFDLPVQVGALVSVDQGAADFESLKTLVETPVEIAGELTAADVANGRYTVYSGGALTLSGGTGSLSGLALNEGAALHVNDQNAYSVRGALEVSGGSRTYFNFSDWEPGGGWALGGSGTAAANLDGGAALTINGIENGKTGVWVLLNNFEGITADAGGWNYAGGTLAVNTSDGSARGDLDDYVVTTSVEGSSYVLTITRPDSTLIWNGTGSDVWQGGSAKRPWLLAEDDDYDTPRTHEGRTFADVFEDGDIVTFNEVGASQPNVTVTGGVSAAMVRVTADDYTFTGDGAVDTSVLAVEDRLGKGTKAAFDVPVHVSELFESGPNTETILRDLSLDLSTPANVNGTVELADVTGGVFSVGKTGTLTLSGGTGSLTGLTVHGGGRLNVNALSSYSVTDSLILAGDSRTYFNFGRWTAGSGFGLGGSGTATADLGSGARLTITGIRQGDTGKWTLLSGFAGITAGGWTADDITLADFYDLTGYTVTAYPEGANYYLEITRNETEPGPEPDPTRDPGHTDVFHISGSVQRSVSSAAEMAALGLLAVEPSPDKHLWAHFWRDAGRVYDEHDALSMKTRAYGVIIGRDLSKNDKKTLGLAAHIGKADVSGKGRWDGATSDTDFWGVLLYGRRETDKWLFTGDVGFSWFKTDYTEAGGATADNARATGLSAGGRVWYKWIEDPRPGRLNVRPFIGLRWNRFRQKGYDYDNGTASAAYTVDQFLVPLGVKFEWGESVNKKNWRTKPSLELSYIRTFGDRDADTSIYERGRRFLPAKTPLSGRDTFSAQFRYNSRREDFQWELNAGVRHNSSETDLNVGATLRWDL